MHYTHYTAYIYYFRGFQHFCSPSPIIVKGGGGNRAVSVAPHYRVDGQGIKFQ